MSKQYYLCDVIGDGLTPETAFRASIQNEPNVNLISLIPTDASGIPLHTYTLVNAATLNHTALRNKSGIDPLPDFPLDGKVSALNAQDKTALINAMAKRGIDTNQVNSADGYRDVIREVGKSIDANFDENNFDVSDI